MTRVVEQRGILQLDIGVGIEPENSGVEDNALFAVLVDFEAAVHKSRKSAVLIVAQGIPERYDVRGKLALYFVSEC